jgi:hypothetical protein
MTSNTNNDRRRRVSLWRRAVYLIEKLRYWLHQRSEPKRAPRFAEELAPLLEEIDAAQESIIGPEGRSLICEATGDVERAIFHRELEVQYIQRLHESFRESPHPSGALIGYDYADLRDRYGRLARLHRQAGDIEKAVAALEASRNLCAKHHVEFTDANVLVECIVEKWFQSSVTRAGKVKPLIAHTSGGPLSLGSATGLTWTSFYPTLTSSLSTVADEVTTAFLPGEHIVKITLPWAYPASAPAMAVARHEAEFQYREPSRSQPVYRTSRHRNPRIEELAGV